MAKIDEVARAAGVSISTVSYALSGKRRVSAATKERIDRVIRELDYRPNAGARMLAGSRSQIFALTEPLRQDTHAPTHMAFVLAASIAARRNEYDILLLTDEDASAGMHRVTATGIADAILALDVGPHDERIHIARQIDIPVIFVGVPDDTDGLICVDLDFEAAAALAVDRLADLGHRSIALIGQTAADYRISNFRPRAWRGFEHRATERGLTITARNAGEHIPDAVEAAVDAALSAGATGIVCHASLEITSTVLDILRTRGLSVPDDISVISLANTFETSGLSVALDEIPLVPAASCGLAVDLALRSLDDPGSCVGIHLIPPSFVERGSSTSPPRR